MRLETDRLILRHWEERDFEPLAAILGDAEVRRFYPKALSREEARAQFDFALARQTEVGFHFGVAESKADGRMLGLVGLGIIGEPLRSALAGRPEVEIGWQFDRSVWGQGYAPEAAGAWLDWGFANLPVEEIVAFTFLGNEPSQRVMQKLGMVRRAEDDFEHPALAAGHLLRPHVLYRKPRTGRAT